MKSNTQTEVNTEKVKETSGTSPSVNGKKWVACWGNATSISDQKEAMYAKNITLRYPIKMVFDGSAIRLHFSNITGTEPVKLTEVYADKVEITFGGDKSAVIEPGEEIISDEINYAVKTGDIINISIYLGEYTQMNSGVLITGPLSKGQYSYGNHVLEDKLPLDLTRNTNWFYFLNTIDVFTDENNYAFICYGDSITAQSWPDYLSILLQENGINNVSIIRRAVSGTRILRQYDCITYAAYGLKGEVRFPVEMKVAGARAVLIQHGINDIIHPVGEEVNPFRPWSDMPTKEEMAEAFERLYIEYAKQAGYKVYVGTLLPIMGWRTYADFRENLRKDFNNWLRSCSENGKSDGIVDFDLAVRNPKLVESFDEGCDSGDHLHPSEEGYKRMAKAAYELIQGLEK